MCSSTANMKSWDTLGHTALKSNRTRPPHSSLRLMVIVASSMSRTFMSMDRPLRNHLCPLLTHLLNKGSHALRIALAISLLSVLTMVKGRVSPGP